MRVGFVAVFWACSIGYLVLQSLAEKYPGTETNPGIAAFVGVCFFNMLAITVVGVRAWPAVPASENNGASLYRVVPDAQVLAVLQGSFQAWDFFMCFVLPELLDPLMVLHHALVAVLSVACFELGVMQEPALFFLGFAEIQSVPLTFLDFFKHIAPERFPDVTLANLIFDVAKYSFVVLFFYARIYLWMGHTKAFVRNAQHSWAQAGDGASKTSGKPKYKAAIAFFAGSCVVLTALQVYWGGLILYEVFKLFV